jgi:hypothetical protein
MINIYDIKPNIISSINQYSYHSDSDVFLFNLYGQKIQRATDACISTQSTLGRSKRSNRPKLAVRVMDGPYARPYARLIPEDRSVLLITRYFIRFHRIYRAAVGKGLRRGHIEQILIARLLRWMYVHLVTMRTVNAPFLHA